METKASVSVIVPAYNAASTLARTVGSILRQTIRDLEVWIVNDGSTDRTGRIADELAKGDGRIRVIHQVNQGPYMARLSALRQIKTKYFGFVDADDTVEPQMYERMIEFAERYELDVVQCRVFGGEVEGVTELYLDHKRVVDDVVIPWLIEGHGGAYVWDKLYRVRQNGTYLHESYDAITFEDMVFNLRYFIDVNRFGRIPAGYYHYETATGSTTRNFNLKNVEEFRLAIRARRILAPSYGVGQDDRRLGEWVVLNARGLISKAVFASAKSWSERMRGVSKLVELAEVQQAQKIVQDARLALAISSPRQLMLEMYLDWCVQLVKRCFRKCLKWRCA